MHFIITLADPKSFPIYCLYDISGILAKNFLLAEGFFFPRFSQDFTQNPQPRSHHRHPNLSPSQIPPPDSSPTFHTRPRLPNPDTSPHPSPRFLSQIPLPTPTLPHPRSHPRRSSQILPPPTPVSYPESSLILPPDPPTHPPDPDSQKYKLPGPNPTLTLSGLGLGLGSRHPIFSQTTQMLP